MNDVKSDDDKQKAVSDTKKTLSCIFIPMGIIVIIMIIIAVMCSFGGSSGATKKTDLSVEALVASQQYCKTLLKAPATAKFPTLASGAPKVKKLSASKYEVISYVDSENSFGAMVRSGYKCVVILSENSYKIEEFNFY